MKKKIIMVPSIVGVIAIIAIIVIVVTTQDLTDFEVPIKQEQKELKTKVTDIVDFDAVQFGNELSLSMSVGNIIPETIDEIPLSDSAIGFAYSWFGDSKTGGGHVEGKGSGHMQGYIVSMYHDTEDGWLVEPVDIDVIPVTVGIDFCISVRDRPAKLTIQNNTIFLDTPPDIKPQVNAFFVDRAASLELGKNPICHPNQIAANIIDIKMSE